MGRRSDRHALRLHSGWAAIAFLIWSALSPIAVGQSASAGGDLAAAIDAARTRVVKLYGARFGREAGYGSGVIVSSDGRIVSTLSVLVEDPGLRVVLADGRRFPARVVARDESTQLAELRIEASDLSFFELGDSQDLQPGDWVIAAANPFKVAEGPEPVSVSVGVLAGRAELAARRRAQDFPYRGQVLLTDVIVATPGSAGGALVDADGRLVGIIGKAVVSTRTNTFANYALPVEEVAKFLARAAAPPESDSNVTNTTPTSAAADVVSWTPLDVGLRLFDVGGRTRPAYIERVRVGSAARRADVRSGDLVLSIAGQQVATCDDFRAALSGLEAGQQTALVVKRGEEILTLELTMPEKPQ